MGDKRHCPYDAYRQNQNSSVAHCESVAKENQIFNLLFKIYLNLHYVLEKQHICDNDLQKR